MNSHKKPARVGMIGVGAMGSRICTNLIRAGFEVRVFDVVPERAAAFQGQARAVCACPEEVARGSEVILVAVRDDAQLEAACFGAGGAAFGIAPGAVLACLSTVSLDCWRSVADHWMAMGGGCLDAAMNGSANENSIDAAERGTLTILVGGDEELLDKVRSVFEAIGSRILHFGPLGTGLVAKLINNALLAINVVATYEMLDLARRSSTSVEKLFQMLETGSGASWVTGHWQRFETMVGLGSRYQPGGTVDLLVKDMHATIAMLDTYGAPAALHRTTGSLMKDLVASWGQARQPPSRG